MALFAIVALVRLFNTEVFHGRVWATYFLIAFIFYLLSVIVLIWLRPSR